MGKTFIYVPRPVWTKACLQQLLHTNCSSGHKAIAAQEENFRGCSGRHLKTHIEPCVLSQVCSLCVPCWQCLPWDYMVEWAESYTAFSPIYRILLSATGRWMHKSMITTAHKPFLMHSRTLLRITSNHTSLPPRLHPASGLQRAQNWKSKLWVSKHLHPLTL